jgi:hypothetical protein
MNIIKNITENIITNIIMNFISTIIVYYTIINETMKHYKKKLEGILPFFKYI